MKSLKLFSINQEAEKTGEKAVGEDIFGLKINPSLISQTIRRILSNQRKAYAVTKTRGQIVGSGIKIWRQKGTGRARHGDKQAPIFVGGSKAHGPTGRQNYRMLINKKMNKKAIYEVLSLKFKEKKVYLIEDFKIAKTKEAFSFLAKAKEKLGLKGKVLILYGPKEEIAKYFLNLREAEIINVANLNAYRLLKAGSLLITRAGLAEILGENKEK